MGLGDFIAKMKLQTGMAKCTEYLELVQLVLDNESTREQEVYLRRHLKMCVKCLEKYEMEKELKKALKIKLQSKEVPMGLADSIRAKIAKSA